MPPVKKKLSAADEKLIEDVKAELDKPADLPDDEQDDDTDKNSPEIGEGAARDGSEPDDAEDTGKNGARDDSDDDQEELVTVAEPCAKCFPDGWPAQEDGAFVNCAHDHGIRYGELVVITKQRARELGFVEVKPAS
jgi:hypothetical protein